MLKKLNKLNQVLLVAAGVLQLAKLVTKLTKTPKDDVVVQKVDAAVLHLTEKVPQ
jgi:hypothetical protein